MKPDCKQFPEWMRWLAQDADGAWWGYEHEPHQADRGWYENEVGLSIVLGKSEVNLLWRTTLEKV